jgi:DNA-binding transcriptional LysR family regulator
VRWDERIGRRLKLRDLHILLTVIQSGSMGRAAAQLRMSQPNVSKAIADMEHALGVRLLDRGAQGVEPTHYGRTTVKWGVAVFDDLRHWVREIEFLTDPTKGQLRIGATEPLAMGLLPAVIERLTRRYPGPIFHVTYIDAALPPYGSLRDRNVDLVFSHLRNAIPKEDEDYVEAESLFEDRLFVVAGIDSPWVRRRKIELAELVDQQWTLPPVESLVNPHIIETFEASGLKPPQATVSTLSIQLHTKLLSTGRFLAMLPRAMLRFSGHADKLKILPVNLATRPWQNGVVKLKNRTLSPLAEAFVECARDVASSLTDSEGKRARRTQLP